MSLRNAAGMTRIFLKGATVVRLSVLAAQQLVIHRAARRAIPRLADFCLIHVATPRSIRCVTAVHRGEQHSRDMLAMLSLRPIPRDDLTSTVACVLRSGRPTLRAAIRNENLDRRGAVAQLYKRLATRSALVVPLVSGDAVLGTVSLCYSHSGRSHALQQVPQAQRFARRVAAALVSAVRATRSAPPRQRKTGA